MVNFGLLTNNTDQRSSLSAHARHCARPPWQRLAVTRFLTMARMLPGKRKTPGKARRAAKRAAKRAGKNAGTTRQGGLVASLFSAILAMWGALQALAGESCAVPVSGGRSHALGCAESTRAEADWRAWCGQASPHA